MSAAPEASPLFPYTTLFRSLLRGSTITPPVGKSGPWTWVISASVEASGSASSIRQASISSPALCGGIEVAMPRSEEHTSELQSHVNLVCRLLLEKKKQNYVY